MPVESAHLGVVVGVGQMYWVDVRTMVVTGMLKSEGYGVGVDGQITVYSVSTVVMVLVMTVGVAEPPFAAPV